MSSEFGNCLFLIFMAMFANLLLYIDYEHGAFLERANSRESLVPMKRLCVTRCCESQSGFRIGSYGCKG